MKNKKIFLNFFIYGSKNWKNIYIDMQKETHQTME
jgi:hypothetical protein